MIIEARKNWIGLSGALNENRWLEIKAAAHLLLKSYPEGIVVDCDHLSECSEAGTRTFLDAIADVARQGTRIVFCNLPTAVKEVIQHVPGARSQLPIAESMQQAVASLGLEAMTTERLDTASGRPVYLVPIFEGIPLERCISIVAQLGRQERAQVYLVYLLEVPRTMPLTAPLVTEEKQALDALNKGKQLVEKAGLKHATHLERVRDLGDGILRLARELQSKLILLCLPHMAETEMGHLQQAAFSIFQHATCEVILDKVAEE